jgi:hypothetical protein
MKELFFKVKFGFGTLDRVSIGEDEIEKAIYAQVTGKPVRLKNSYINGRNMISITPDYHKYTGWHETYDPKDHEDFRQIERDCPKFDGVLEAYTDRVRTLIESGRESDIGKLGKVSLQGIENSKREFGMKGIGEFIK